MGHTVSQDQSSQVFYGDRGSQVLAAKAGNFAIKKNDLVVLRGSPARVFPAETSDYAAVAAAGSSAVALTTVSSIGTQFETRNRGVVDPATGDIFIADTYLTGPVGCQIWKYNSAGTLQRSLILDSATTGNTNYVQIRFLANGNLLVFWCNVATPYTLFFAIVDKNLQVVVAKTTIASAATNPQLNADCLPLSGGGFAVVWSHAGVGDYFTIRDNAGAVVYAATLIAGAPTNSSGNSNGPRHKLAELSNGNIFVGINDTNDPSNGLRYTIFSPTGAIVKAFTTINASGSGAYPEIAVMPGFVLLSNNANAYVLNNAGTIQGGAVALTSGSTTRVVTDGSYFWVFQSASGLVMKRIPTTGTNIITNTLAGFGTITGDVFIERGTFVAFDGANSYVISVDAAGFPTLLASNVFLASMMQTIGAIGDFCAIGFQVGKFQITKYLSASIFGVSQSDIPAGNEGALVTVIAGIGGYPTNSIKGSVGKAFDHTGASIVGNKGAMYLDSVLLKGL